MLVKLATLHRALEDDSLVPSFQPLVELRSGQLTGFEVLARWQHPRYGPILPANLIGLAEKHGLVTGLMHQVFRKAFKAFQGMPNQPELAVNISATQLSDLNLPNQIFRLADEAEFPLSKLMIEITETALVGNLQRAKSILEDLRDMGCRLALDDFGTGYSSLSHLQALPFHEIKIDRSFVSGVTNMRESRKIVTAIIALGHSLDLTTVGEGVETEAQRDMLLRFGCDMGQGWLYGRPVLANQLPYTLASFSQNSPRLSLADNSGFEALPVQRLSLLRAIYDGSPFGLAFLDTKLRYVAINRQLAEINGFPVEKHLGREVKEIIPEAFPCYEPYLRRALRGEAIRGVEVRRPGSRPGVPDRITLASYQPTFDEADEVIGISVAVADITDLRRSQKCAAETGQPEQELAMSVPPGIMSSVLPSA
jgi:PAS domain S-box-containing protein